MPHTKKSPKLTLTYTQRRKITVKKIQNHSNALTHTHPPREKHIKYQRVVKQTKVNTH